MASKGLFLLGWLCFLHAAGLYLFTRGFLLSRLSLSDHSTCSTEPCTLAPTHKRMVLLIIDALRFDFLAEHPPEPASAFHHHVLTLPQELTAAADGRSVLFNAFSDPPTTTLQRIKGLVTGSLPTFMDMGNNFGGSEIEEDSWVKQASLHSKKIAFMGDDTWMTVFPNSFKPSMTFPYDSFNVEDLHTVDEGVIEHLFPLLDAAEKPWDVLIGHFLGVDHVGHRVGPDHPTMRAKLAQMDTVLRRVVAGLDDETLLVVLGDHGMDRRGDHGGDGALETQAGVWLYSNTPFVAPSAQGHENVTFPGAPVAHRSIQQIDLVPTLSLLLGLPVPFNNLGTVIPELFAARGEYEQALALNAAQVKRYLDAYRASGSGGELDGVWAELEELWEGTHSGGPERSRGYTRTALEACRGLWAQFDVVLMGLGLALIASGVFAAWAVFAGLGSGLGAEDWEGWAMEMMPKIVRGCAAGAVIGLLAFFGLQEKLKGRMPLDLVIFGAAAISSLIAVGASAPQISFRSFPLALVVHALAFMSNSFTFWEDRLVQYLLLSTLAPAVLAGATAPTAALRKRILGFATLFAACVRGMAASTVCREEQQPYCRVTFFAGATLPAPPLVVRVLCVPVAVLLPSVLMRVLAISKSDRGAARLFFPMLFRGVLLAANACWVLEWAEAADVVGAEGAGVIRVVRTVLARSAFGGILVAGGTLWWMVPACVEISVRAPTAEGKKRQAAVFGFANAFGAPYLVFWAIALGTLTLATQLTGQITLALAAVAAVAHLEIVDSVRDVGAMQAAFASATPSAVLGLQSGGGVAPVKFGEVVPLALLGMHAFFATGHQAVISSIQWKTAFVLTPTLSYPLSPALVLLNTFGPQFVLALFVPLLALWNVAPAAGVPEKVTGGAIRAGAGVMAYYGTLLLGSAASAAWLRRHLMVWKVFAPRFMLGAASVLAVDLAVLLGVGLGVRRVTGRIGRMFAGVEGVNAPRTD